MVVFPRPSAYQQQQQPPLPPPTDPAGLSTRGTLTLANCVRADPLLLARLFPLCTIYGRAAAWPQTSLKRKRNPDYFYTDIKISSRIKKQTRESASNSPPNLLISGAAVNKRRWNQYLISPKFQSILKPLLELRCKSSADMQKKNNLICPNIKRFFFVHLFYQQKCKWCVSLVNLYTRITIISKQEVSECKKENPHHD